MESKKKRIARELEGMLPGYKNNISNTACLERYEAKLAYADWEDPYEIPRCEWKDDIEFWPSLSYIHVGMYLLFSSSVYTEEMLMDYKNLDCYQKFESGWVQEVKVKCLRNGRRLMIAKVCIACLTI